MQEKYVKLVDGLPQEPPVNKDNIINYNLDIEQLILDGYKILIPAEIPPETEIRQYHLEYIENEDNITETVIFDETQEEAEERLLKQAKESKTFVNEQVRDKALIRGVIYKSVLFDSDTDQKINLMYTSSQMDETDTILWFGMDNVPLECTKEDLINIGNLIAQLHTYCWTLNASIKEQINNAETVEEVENIIIDYTFREE